MATVVDFAQRIIIKTLCRTDTVDTIAFFPASPAPKRTQLHGDTLIRNSAIIPVIMW
jgi:hypothetical protein